MFDLTVSDLALIGQAAEIIKRNYDGVKYFHTVGSALRCKNGNVYLGVNVFSVHGSCAEYIAIGAAITAGEREFDCIVSVGGDDLDEIYPPCGNCRQMLLTYMPDGFVIVKTEEGPKKVGVRDLIPYGYEVK
jgi:cytidine deaminase